MEWEKKSIDDYSHFPHDLCDSMFVGIPYIIYVLQQILHTL